MECDRKFTDPVVWTNQHVVEWIQSIDLEVSNICSFIFYYLNKDPM